MNKFKSFGRFYNDKKKSDPLSVDPFVKRRHMGLGADVSMEKGKRFVPQSHQTDPLEQAVPEYKQLKNLQNGQTGEYIINANKAKALQGKIGDNTGITLLPHPTKPGMFILRKVKQK